MEKEEVVRVLGMEKKTLTVLAKAMEMEQKQGREKTVALVKGRLVGEGQDWWVAHEMGQTD